MRKCVRRVRGGFQLLRIDGAFGRGLALASPDVEKTLGVRRLQIIRLDLEHFRQPGVIEVGRPNYHGAGSLILPPRPLLIDEHKVGIHGQIVACPKSRRTEPES
jgi:hypothetical protein